MTPAAEGFSHLRRAFEQAGVRYAVTGSWASSVFGEPRFTNDVDIVAELTEANLHRFLASLPITFYADQDEAKRSLQAGRPFNVIYMPMALKYDLFPAGSSPLGIQELDRLTLQTESSLAREAAPFVTPEDILLAKLNSFRMGSGVSEVQWRDIEGLVRLKGLAMNHRYLQTNAATLGVTALLHLALAGAPMPSARELEPPETGGSPDRT